MRMWETGPPARSVGMHDAAAARKTGWQFFKKFEKESTKQPSDSTSESVPRRTESRVLERYLYTHVHRSTIHNSSLKIYQWMNRLKKNVLQTTVRVSVNKEGNSDTLHRGWSLGMYITYIAKSLQSCLTLCDPIPGILQARTLEWVAISFSSAWKWKVKMKSLSHVQLFETPWTAVYQAPLSMGFSRQENWSRVPLPSPLELANALKHRLCSALHLALCILIVP